jgi:hypothetical protein
VTQSARATSTEDAVGSNAATVARVIDAVRRRMRLQRVGDAIAQAGALALTLFGLLLVYTKLHVTREALVTGLYCLAMGLPCLLVCMAAWRSTPRLTAARLIDRAHRLPDLMSSAWAFSQLSANARTPFANAALAQAADASRSADPTLALPLRWPAALWAWPLLALGVVCLWQLPDARSAPAPEKHPVAVLQELLFSRAQVTTELRELTRARGLTRADASVDELTHELERLLDLVAKRRIDRLQLLRALAELETRTLGASQHSAQQAAELRELGRALASQGITRELGTALATGDLAAGQAALRKLAKRAATAPDLRELERLRAALRSAVSRRGQAREARMAEAKRALDTLQRERDAAAASQSAEARAAKQRQLDEQVRQERETRQRERELDKLERELDQAARRAQPDTGQTAGNAPADPAQTARDMQTAAETLDQMQRAEEHDRSLARLNQRIAELRQGLAQGAAQQPQAPTDEHANQASGEAPLTLSQFQRLARGERAGEATPSSAGDSQQPRGVVQKDSPSGAEPTATPKQLIAEGQSGAPEHAASARGRPEQGPATPSGRADVDLAVAGIMGKGPSRSSVIYDAAARGFGTHGYQKVHADYTTHAESELEREPLPAGYRFTVRRYFQLIQPREDSHE